MQQRFAPLWPCSFLVALLAMPALAAEDTTAIYVMNVDGSEARLLARVDGHQRHECPRWSHDGKRVAFNARPIGKTAAKIFVVNADGSGQREICWGAMPAWSPNDKLLAYSVDDNKGRSMLAIENLDDQELTMLTLGRSPCWSLDGDRLAAVEPKNAFLIDLQTGKSSDLFGEQFASVLRGLAFSPNGRHLAVVVLVLNEPKNQLLFVDLDNAEHKYRVRLKSDLGGFVSFSPDGKQLVYSSGFRLYIVDVEGQGISRMIPGQKERNHNPDWSPDGKSIVFVSNRAN